MKILGIDPGYGITGFGLIDAQRGQYRLLGCGAITTPPNTDFPWRLEVIYNDMTQLLQTAQPEAVAIEELFFGQNVTTGINVAQSRGVILLAIRQAGLPVQVDAVTTAEYGASKAARPFNSRLDKSKLAENGFTPLPDWKDALARYLKEIAE